MSVSEEMRMYDFAINPAEVSNTYDADEVDDLLLKWAKKVEKLEEDEKLLNALRACGVDNWAGYEYALDMIEDEDN